MQVKTEDVIFVVATCALFALLVGKLIVSIWERSV